MHSYTLYYRYETDYVIQATTYYYKEEVCEEYLKYKLLSEHPNICKTIRIEHYKFLDAKIIEELKHKIEGNI